MNAPETLAVRCSDCGDLIPDCSLRVATGLDPVYCDRCDAAHDLPWDGSDSSLDVELPYQPESDDL